MDRERELVLCIFTIRNIMQRRPTYINMTPV